MVGNVALGLESVDEYSCYQKIGGIHSMHSSRFLKNTVDVAVDALGAAIAAVAY